VINLFLAAKKKARAGKIDTELTCQQYTIDRLPAPKHMPRLHQRQTMFVLPLYA